MKQDKQMAAVKGFKNALTLISKRKESYWSSIKFLGEDKILDYWNALTAADKKRIVSAKTWNRYPLESYRGKKIFGPVIWKLVDVIMHSSERERKMLINNSEGVFALIVFSLATSEEKNKMSKRLIHSPDQRLRSRAVDSLPLKHLKKAIYDSDSAIAYKAVRRIGISNCYKDFLPTKSQISSGKHLKYLSVIAMREASYDDVKDLISAINESTTDMYASILISKIPKDNIVFYLDEKERGYFSKEIILKKLGIMPKY